MTKEELIEKCRLADREIGKTFTRHQKSHPHHQWDSTGMFRAMVEAQLTKALPIIKQALHAAISIEVGSKAFEKGKKAERKWIINLIGDVDLPSVSDFYQDPKDMDSYVYGYNDGQGKTIEAIEQAFKGETNKENGR